MTAPGNDYLIPPEADDARFVPEHLVLQEYAHEAPFDSDSAAPAPAEEQPQSKVNAAIARATAGGLAGMSPAERIAALTAIKDAIDARVKWEKQVIVENLLGATKAQSIPTSLGNLSFKPASRPVKFDEEKLLAYVQEHHPEHVTERVVVEIDTEFRKLLTSAVVNLGDGDFGLSTDGTTIDFAYLGDETDAQIAYPASSEQKIVKAQARKAIDEHFLILTSGMLDAGKEAGL